MECPNCSIPILDHAKVCPFCQTRLDDKLSVDMESEKDEKKIKKTKKKRKNKKVKETKKNEKLKTDKSGSSKIQRTNTHNNKQNKYLDNSEFDSSFSAVDFDISYTINREEQAQIIRNAIDSVSVPSSRPQNKHGKKKKRISNKVRRCIFFSILTILFCALLFWSCSSIYRTVNGNKNSYVFTYMKNNIFMASTGNTSVMLTNNLIDNDEYKKSQQPNVDIENSADPEIQGLTAEKVIEIMGNHNLVYKSYDEKYIYFLSKFNISTNLGELKCFDVKKEKIIDIAENVSNSIKLSSDGKSVLFLQNSDFSGNNGVLCYYNIKKGGIINVSGDIDKDAYVFSQKNNKVLFIGNFNHSLEVGDLFEYNLNDKNAEQLKIDSDVCKIFGTDKTGDIYLYAKDYNASLGCYDIYKKDGKEERKKLIEQSALPPIISSKSNEIYIYGGIENGMHNIYLVNIVNEDKQKIASGVSDIVKISDNEKSILYRKVYDEKTEDYYIYTKGNTESQKVASDVRVIQSDSKFSGNSQISVSDDFSNIAYISGFDIEKGKGALYRTEYSGGAVKKSDKVSDDAFLCQTSNDGKRIIYAKNYSLTRDVVDIYNYENLKSDLLKEEIDFNLFEISENGDNIICISDFNTSGEFGTLEIVDLKANIHKISDDVSAFYILKNEIFMLKNYNGNVKTFDIYRAYGKDKTDKMDSDVTYIIV